LTLDIVTDIDISKSEDAQSVIAVAKSIATQNQGLILKRSVQIGNTTGIISVNVDKANVIVIGQPLTRLAFTPRSGKLKDTPFRYKDMANDVTGQTLDYTPGIEGTGWIPQGTLDNGKPKYGYIPFGREEVFPDIAGRRASVAYSKDGNSIEFLNDLSNYGNLSWVSPDGLYGVSWKGTEARLLRNTWISKAWEAFGEVVYVNGESIPAPIYVIDPENPEPFTHNLILGASIPEGVIFVITLHRDELPGRGNQYCVYRYDGEWKLVSSINISYDGLPWFADNTGYSFIHPSGSEIDIDPISLTASLIAAPSVSPGTATEKYETGSSPTFTKNFTKNFLYEFSRSDADDEGNYLPSQRLSSTMVVQQNISSAGFGDSSTQNSKFDIEAIWKDYTSEAWIDGPNTLSVGAVYSLKNYNGTYCSIRWSVPSKFDDFGSYIVITDTTSCGIGTITATIVGGGNAGDSVSKDVKYPNGVWVVDSEVGEMSFSCEDYGFPKYTTIFSGGSRYLVMWYAGYTCEPTEVGFSISGVDEWGNEHTFPDNVPVPTHPGSGCNTGCFAKHSINVLEGPQWGSCGVCGTCSGCDHEGVYALRYTRYYVIYKWVCP